DVDLAAEVLDDLGLGAQGLLDDLDDDVAGRLGLAGDVDLRHAAFVQEPADPVLAQNHLSQHDRLRGRRYAAAFSTSLGCHFGSCQWREEVFGWARVGWLRGGGTINWNLWIALPSSVSSPATVWRWVWRGCTSGWAGRSCAC